MGLGSTNPWRGSRRPNITLRSEEHNSFQDPRRFDVPRAPAAAGTPPDFDGRARERWRWLTSSWRWPWLARGCFSSPPTSAGLAPSSAATRASSGSGSRRTRPPPRPSKFRVVPCAGPIPTCFALFCYLPCYLEWNENLTCSRFSGLSSYLFRGRFRWQLEMMSGLQLFVLLDGRKFRKAVLSGRL